MRDRGQMILVAGVMLAVLFVALAVLVNAAIYTDNVATRGDGSTGEVLEYRAGVVDSVGGLIDAENADGNHSDADSIETDIENGTDEIDGALQSLHLRRGAVATVDASGMDATSGLLIRETNVTGFENWDVNTTTFETGESNATAVRSFVIDLDTANMPDGSPFRIDLDGTVVEVNKTGGQIVVTGGEASADCAVSADETVRVRFDVTGERLGGEPCRFGWPSLDDDSRISIENGANGAGTYELTAASGDDPDTVSGGVATEAIYSVTDLELRVETPKLRYETTVRVAPGEPDA